MFRLPQMVLSFRFVLFKVLTCFFSCSCIYDLVFFKCIFFSFYICFFISHQGLVCPKVFSFTFVVSSCCSYQGFLFLKFFCFFFLSKWIFFQVQAPLHILVLLQVMMIPCMTWMKRLHCSFNVGWWHGVFEISSIHMKWKGVVGNQWTRPLVFKMCWPQPLQMKFVCPQPKRELLWAPICPSYRYAYGSLMEPQLRFESVGRTKVISLDLMDERESML